MDDSDNEEDDAGVTTRAQVATLRATGTVERRSPISRRNAAPGVSH